MGSSSSNIKRSTLVDGPAKLQEGGRLSMAKGQTVSPITDLPPKAASLAKAADRQFDTIKPANGHPLSYSAAVGPPPFSADVVTPRVGDKAPISDLLHKYRGSSKHEQLNKLTKGSRPFTSFRSIRGESAQCNPMRFGVLVMGTVASVPFWWPSCCKCAAVALTALPDWTRTPAVIAGYKALKSLLHDSCGKSIKEMLSTCKQQGPSDDMVSLLRAFTAKGFMDKDTQYLPWVQDHTGCPG
ncbi:TPA: hypothetical protein ACH3X1_003456 [Trebouxia sp. C0004]